jgi:carbon storage regulator CsrA
MLVVSRRKNQTLKFGEVTITILKGGENVKIGIDAPRHIEVLRGEVPNRMLSTTEDTEVTEKTCNVS